MELLSHSRTTPATTTASSRGRPPNAAACLTSAWYRAIDARLLEPLHPGVARLVGAAESPVSSASPPRCSRPGPGAMASHRSAAHLWGIPRPDDDPVDVILPSVRREATLDAVVVHRPRDRKDLSPVLRQNIRTSNILRLLCDLGAVDPRSVPAAVGHVVSTGMASPVALRTAVDVHARRGRHGVPAFREALDEWVIDGKPADSVLEPAMASARRRVRLAAGRVPSSHPRVRGRLLGDRQSASSSSATGGTPTDATR